MRNNSQQQYPEIYADDGDDAGNGRVGQREAMPNDGNKVEMNTAANK